MDAVTRELRCTVTTDGRVAVAGLVGTLDPATAVEARGALLKCLAAQPDLVVVDLAGVTVGDDMALSVFAAAADHAAAWPGCAIVLCAPRPEVALALRRLGISRAVPVHATVGEALAMHAASPAPRRYREHLQPSPASAARARHLVAEACRAWSLAALSETAQLIATELVSNAVRHARTDVDIIVSLRRRYLHISVRDHSTDPPRRGGGDDLVGGRGLLVVEALSTTWGSAPTLDGKVVWATLGHTVPDVAPGRGVPDALPGSETPDSAAGYPGNRRPPGQSRSEVR